MKKKIFFYLLITFNLCIEQVISLENKTNFFEKRVAEYSKAGVSSTKPSTGTNLSFDDEF